MTCVSSARPERSKVVPEGTAILLRTRVAHAVADLEAEAAPAEPVNVQLVARLATTATGAAVMAGDGAAATDAARAKRRPRVDATIVKMAWDYRVMLVC